MILIEANVLLRFDPSILRFPPLRACSTFFEVTPIGLLPTEHAPARFSERFSLFRH
jgi:hypothetical protein